MAITDTEFEIDGTHFTVQKHSAMPAWFLLEKIRRQIGRQFDVAELRVTLNMALADDNPEAQEAVNAGVPARDMRVGVATGLVIADVVLKLDEQFVEMLRKEMFKRIYFRIAGAEKAQPLIGLEDSAFTNAGQVYVVLSRALAANFTDSLAAIFGGFQLEIPAGLQ